MATVRDALDALYSRVDAGMTTVSMREFLGHYAGNNAGAAIALSGSTDKSSKAYKAAIREVQRYNNYIAGSRDPHKARNPDRATAKLRRRATQAEARREVKRHGIKVKNYRGKIQTSPKRKRRGKGGSFEKNDANRTRTIRNVNISLSKIDSELLDGDTRAFSDAFLDAYGAGEIGELYDIDALELELGDGDGGDDEEPDDDE